MRQRNSSAESALTTKTTGRARKAKTKLAAGCVRLVGTDAARIVAEVSRLLDDPAAALAMRSANNPYGDGQACRRILARLRQHFGLAQGNPA